MGNTDIFQFKSNGNSDANFRNTLKTKNFGGKNFGGKNFGELF